MKIQTYATETAAKKAAARAYRSAIVQLVNGRYACFQTGNPLPHGARTVSRWGTNQWSAYDYQEIPYPLERSSLEPGDHEAGTLPDAE